MKTEYVNVKIIDEDHVWLKDQQYVSLNRFMNVKSEAVEELRNFEAQVKELTKENEALKVLLKDKLLNEE